MAQLALSAQDKDGPPLVGLSPGLHHSPEMKLDHFLILIFSYFFFKQSPVTDSVSTVFNNLLYLIDFTPFEKLNDVP